MTALENPFSAWPFKPAEPRPAIGEYVTCHLAVSINIIELAFFDGEVWRNPDSGSACENQNRAWLTVEEALA